MLAILLLLVILPNSRAHAATNNFITSVDVMKYTKDTVTNQPSDAQIAQIVSAIVNNIDPQYIAISVPLDDASAYPASGKPSPRTPAAFAQKWVDAIRAQGAKVMFRGTWSGLEGIYNFPPLVGPSRFPLGAAATAATDGNSTWLGKTYNYIIDNPNLFADGDIWAVLPERTEGIFSNSTSFAGYDGSSLQQTYAQFFRDLNTVSAQAFARIGKKVTVGASSNNFSEISSGWLPQSLVDSDNMIVVDYYGTSHTPQEMEASLTAAYQRYGKPIFLQEWGDYWDSTMSQADRTAYLNRMYAVFKKLADEKILVGLNYWGAWPNNAEGILTQNGNNFSINYRGQLLANFFASVNPASPAQSATAPKATSVPGANSDSSAAATVVPPANIESGARLDAPAAITAGDAQTQTQHKPDPDLTFLEVYAFVIIVVGVILLLQKLGKKL